MFRVSIRGSRVTGLLLMAACLAQLQTGHSEAGRPQASAAHAPQSAVNAIQLADADLQIELVASEPTIVDPVAARFDEHGRLWVVEMRDYPTGPAAGKAHAGRIVVLTDADGDGLFELSTTFADQLVFPTGLQPWKGGAFVTLAGEIAYFADDDGDGVCDRRETWFTGFHQGNEQLRANHPTLGPDGMIYVACGLRGGTIRSARPGSNGELSVSVNGRDFRFDPRGTTFEAIAGHGQFGLTFDDYGRRFICMNARPLSHVVLDEADLGRNPNFADSTTVEHVIPGGQTEPVYPLIEQWTTSTFHKGSWTAACGVHIHRGTALGDAFSGNAFICEPTGSLVHREILTPKGPTFGGKPAHEEREFIASTDPWFRPVNLLDGPDGSLYIVDMARKEIEHPQWMPPEAVKRADFISGNDLGRIYRIRSKSRSNRGNRGRLSNLSDEELTEVLLTTHIGWERETAFRLILERGRIASTLVRESLETSAGKVAEFRLRGLLTTTQPTELAAAIKGDDPRLTEAALQLRVERTQPWTADEIASLKTAAESNDAFVRLHAAIALGQLAIPDRAQVLAAIAVRGPTSPWINRAVFSSASDLAAELLFELLENQADPNTITEACKLAVRENPQRFDELVATLRRQSDQALRWAGFQGIASAATDQMLNDLPTHARPRLSPALLKRFENGDLAAATTIAAFAPAETDWARLITRPTDAAARADLIATLARRSCFPLDEELLVDLPLWPTSVRAAYITGCLRRPNRTVQLLQAVRDEWVSPAVFDNTQAARLRTHKNELVAKIASEVLPTPTSDRPAVISRYALSLESDAAAADGLAVFKKHCASCHRIGELGGNVGPDLSDLRTKTPAQLLQAILDPNAAIDANYINHIAITANGQAYSGLLVGESGQAVTLRGPDARETTILRTDLESLTPTGQSIMPEGLERQLDQQAMADVIYYLKNWRYETSR